MKHLIMWFVLVGIPMAKANAEGKIQTVQKPTGKEYLLSISECSSPVLGAATGFYVSSFSKVSCVEIETYQAEVSGSAWNRKENRLSIPVKSYHQKMTELPFTSADFSSPSNSDHPLLDLAVEALEAASHMAYVKRKCETNRQMLLPLIVSPESTPCRLSAF